MPTLRSPLPDDILFTACERFLKRESATSIAEWIKSLGYACTREQIYPIINQSLTKRFLKLTPPQELQLAQDVSARYPQAADVRVLNVRGSSVADHLAAAGAYLIASLIREVAEDRKRNHVHIGFGAGGTTQRVARHLGRLVESEIGFPHLTIHALSSGFATDNPQEAPVSFFSYFADVRPAVDCVGLFAPAVVPYQDYDTVKALPGVRESYDEAGKIDIVITSLAHASGEHGLLNRFFCENEDAIRKLEDAGWIGDMQWRPFSNEGPITVDTGIRAMTLFELGELKAMVESGKHVVLVAGPCLRCEQSKSEALLPLVKEPSLHVFNHLVTDVHTAKELLE